MSVPAQQPEDYPGVCTTITIKAAQSADRSKPVWRCVQAVKTRSQHKIYLAEAMSNVSAITLCLVCHRLALQLTRRYCLQGANEWLLNGFMGGSPQTLGTAAGTAPPPEKSTTGTWGEGNYGYQEMLRSAQFGNSDARFLLTDREKLADGAVVYCLACQLLRGFVGTLGSSSPLLHTGSLPAVGRLLEHAQTSWEFLAFGQTTLWQAPASTFKRLIPPSPGGVKPYAWVALPYVDAISDHEVALLSAYVRGGGHLVLIGTETGTLYHDLNPRAQPAFFNLTKISGRGSVVMIPDAEFLVYKFCGGYPAACLQARLNLWETYFKMNHEASARVLVRGAPLSVWINTWQQASPSGPIAVHLVNYRTNGTLNCNLSSTPKQPQTGAKECDCSCEVQPHNNSVVNMPVSDYFKVSLRIDASDFSASNTTEAWLYSPDNPSRKLAVDRETQGFLTATVPAGMDVYSICVFVSCEAELKARTQASETRKWLERLVVADSSVGVSLFGTKSDSAARIKAMIQADQLLAQIQGDKSKAMSSSEYEAISAQLSNVTSVLQALLAGLRSSVTGATATHRSGVAGLCATPGSCLAAFNMGPPPRTGADLGPPGFASVTANTTYSSATGFGFIQSDAAAAVGLPLAVGSVDSILPDSLHRSLLWGSERTRFRLDISNARLHSSGDLLITVVSGVHDFA